MAEQKKKTGDVEKKVISVQVPIKTAKAIERLAKEQYGGSVSEVLRAVLFDRICEEYIK